MFRDSGFRNPHLFRRVRKPPLVYDGGESLHFRQSVHCAPVKYIARRGPVSRPNRAILRSLADKTWVFIANEGDEMLWIGSERTTKKRSDAGGEAGSLVDRALCIQLCRDIGAADDMHSAATLRQRIGQAALTHLPGA